jgi:outer membrane protein TolC
MLLPFITHGQHNLQGYIVQATQSSLPAQQSQTAFQLAQAHFKTFQLTNKPSLSAYGNIPSYNKDNYAVTQPDGNIRFLPRSQNYSNAGIGFTQPIGLTGGSLSVNTDLYRFDNFTAHTKQYNGTPVFVRLSQPLFQYNAYKWDKQTAPLRLQEAEQTYKAAQLQTEYEVCRLFFTVLAAQEDEKLATANLENSNTNLAIERRRVQLGVSTEDKVLGLEVQQINSQQQQTTALLNIRKAFLELYNYINSTDTGIKKLQLPEVLPEPVPDKKTIIGHAKKNLPQYIAFQRKRKETEAKLSQAKMQGRQIDLSASYGLNNVAADIPAIYKNPQDQQRFSIGFTIPIAEWGKRKNSLSVAKLQQEQMEISIKQEEAKLLLDIAVLVDELPVLRNNISQSLALDTLSQKRFVITNRLFQSGKASLLELQAAQSEKDNARRNYIVSLQRFWEGWYLLRAKVMME